MPSPNASLRRLRKRADMSLRELAAAAGVTAATISRIETGKRWGDPVTLRAIAGALGVEPEEIGCPTEVVA